MKVARRCFNSQEVLSEEAFRTWMHDEGAFIISHSNKTVQHYSPLHSNAERITYMQLLNPSDKPFQREPAYDDLKR